MTEGIVPFRAWETWYRLSGQNNERPPLVCLHGGPGSTHHYFGRLEALVSQARPVVVYDQLGCGRSSRPPVSELGLGLFIDELTNLRELLGLREIHLLGTSWGGMLALEYALTQPRGLAGLVLSSTLACMTSWANEARRLLDEMPEPHRSALVAGGPGPAFEEAERAFNERHLCRLPDAPEIERMRRESSKGVYNALWGPNEWTPTGTLAGWDVRDRLREIEVPTLLTGGKIRPLHHGDSERAPDRFASLQDDGFRGQFAHAFPGGGVRLRDGARSLPQRPGRGRGSARRGIGVRRAGDAADS